MNKHLTLIIFGQVQGVSFRYNVKMKAEKLNLTGWVKNEGEGTVKIVVEGPEEDLKKFLTYCQEGPTFAQVEKIEENWETAQNEFNDFKIKFY